MALEIAALRRELQAQIDSLRGELRAEGRDMCRAIADEFVRVTAIEKSAAEGDCGPWRARH
jgi:hypothetical protein